MKTAQELRAGNVVMIGNDPMVILKTEYNKSGRNAAVVKIKMKNVFMDTEYNQYEIEAENMGDTLNYLVDGMEDVCEVVFYNGKAISVELPTTIVREVEYTEPAVRGDTSGKVMKPARLKGTTFELPVAAFVEIGDKIEIDTRTNEFKKRA
jgi:elongation factor P